MRGGGSELLGEERIQPLDAELLAVPARLDDAVV